MLVGGVSRERVDDVHVAWLPGRKAHWAPDACLVDQSAHVLQAHRIRSQYASDITV